MVGGRHRNELPEQTQSYGRTSGASSQSPERGPDGSAMAEVSAPTEATHESFPSDGWEKIELDCAAPASPASPVDQEDVPMEDAADFASE